MKNQICQRIIGHSIKNKWFNLNRKLVDVNIPKDSNYQYQASSNILDGIITSITGGLITTRTEKIYIKK